MTLGLEMFTVFHRAGCCALHYTTLDMSDEFIKELFDFSEEEYWYVLEAL